VALALGSVWKGLEMKTLPREKRIIQPIREKASRLGVSHANRPPRAGGSSTAGGSDRFDEGLSALLLMSSPPCRALREARSRGTVMLHLPALPL
jgi:hypothetical protein